MREVPGVRLTEVKVLDKVAPSNYNVVATDLIIEGHVLGNVYKDPGALKARMVWAAWVRDGGQMIELGHFGTRQKAMLEVAKKWALFRDEDEAYGIVEVMTESRQLAREHAQDQRNEHEGGSHLVTELYARHVLNEPTEQLWERLSRETEELQDMLNGRGTTKLELSSVERLAYETTMIELEMTRRGRQEPTCDCLSYSSMHEPDCVPSRPSEDYQDRMARLLKPTDGALIRSIHQHIVSPWKMTPGVMEELLNAVRELEAKALDNEKRRPASMVVEIQDSALKPLVDRLDALEKSWAAKHKVLKARTTMLLAGVVTALDQPEDKTMLRLLNATFAMPDEAGEEDPYKDLLTPEFVSCDCPRGDDMVHELDCINYWLLHQMDKKAPEPAPEPPVDTSWRSNPYSLPPATREGVECPSCRWAAKRAAGLTTPVQRVYHADQATVNECVRRQEKLGFIAPELWKDYSDSGYGEA